MYNGIWITKGSWQMKRMEKTCKNEIQKVVKRNDCKWKIQTQGYKRRKEKWMNVEITKETIVH